MQMELCQSGISWWAEYGFYRKISNNPWIQQCMYVVPNYMRKRERRRGEREKERKREREKERKRLYYLYIYVYMLCVCVCVCVCVCMYVRVYVVSLYVALCKFVNVYQARLTCSFFLNVSIFSFIMYQDNYCLCHSTYKMHMRVRHTVHYVTTILSKQYTRNQQIQWWYHQ